VNGNRIGSGYVEEANTIDNQRTPLTFQSTLNLNKGDRLWLEISIKSGVRMFDDSGHHTHFTGFLLEEEIVASLYFIRNAQNDNRLTFHTKMNF
jgi:hypothetical protein